MKNNHSGINQKSNFVLSEMFYNQNGIKPVFSILKIRLLLISNLLNNYKILSH